MRNLIYLVESHDGYKGNFLVKMPAKYASGNYAPSQWSEDITKVKTWWHRGQAQSQVTTLAKHGIEASVRVMELVTVT